MAPPVPLKVKCLLEYGSYSSIENTINCVVEEEDHILTFLRLDDRHKRLVWRTFLLYRIHSLELRWIYFNQQLFRERWSFYIFVSFTFFFKKNFSFQRVGGFVSPFFFLSSFLVNKDQLFLKSSNRKTRSILLVLSTIFFLLITVHYVLFKYKTVQ